MLTFTLTYTITADGTALQLNPAGETISADNIDRIEFVNNAGSEITLEAIPSTCSAFKKPEKLMHFTIKHGKSKSFQLRPDLPGAFRTESEFLPFLWRAVAKNGLADPTPLIPGPINFQLLVRQ